MSSVKTLVACAAVILWLASPAFANGASERVKPIRAHTVSTYNAANKCQVICKGSKPVLEYVADGFAYALDIPLAILSPITCPVFSPLIHAFDDYPDRIYRRNPRRR